MKNDSETTHSVIRPVTNSKSPDILGLFPMAGKFKDPQTSKGYAHASECTTF